MSDSIGSAPARGDGAGGSERHPEIDWAATARSPEFKELVRKRNRFVVPATVFFLAWFFGFIILAGYAPDFMGEEFLTDGLTVGYVFALTQFLMVWGLGWWYLRKANREFDPLTRKVVESATRAERARSGRFERPAARAPEEVARR